MKKLIALVTFGAGYVLGTKAGRERYQQIMGMVSKAKQDPHVQKAAHQATDFAKEQAPVFKEKAEDVANRVADKVKPGSGEKSDPDATSGLHTESSFGRDPYPSSSPLP